jgi:hypothetical protein
MAESWSDRRIENYVCAAREIGKICREVRRQQIKFLNLVGLTWDEARDLPERSREILQDAWTIYSHAATEPVTRTVMLTAKQHATDLRARTHPDCPECVSRLSGPEVYTVKRFRDNALLAWDIDLAIEICQDGRQPIEIPRNILEDILKVNGTTPYHLDHVSLDFPGIACAVDFTPEDEPIRGLIDGSHRAARSLRDNAPFFAYLLSDEESLRCQSTPHARTCAFLESILRSLAVGISQG